MSTSNPETDYPANTHEDARLRVIAMAEELIASASENPELQFGDWQVGVFPDREAVMFGRGACGNLYDDAQSVIVEKNIIGQEPVIEVFAYLRTLTAQDDLVIRKFHSGITPDFDRHVALQTTKENLMSPLEPSTTKPLEIILSDIEQYLAPILASKDTMPTPPVRPGWLRRLGITRH